MKLNLILQKFGLTAKEASLYLAALELGSASVQKIAGKAGVVRSTGYEVLEVLRGKGLVTTFLKKRVRYYSAEDPNQVRQLAESRLDTLKDALPELNALAGKTRHRPSVRFYEGTEGMRTILKEILAEASELSAFGAAEDLFKEFSDFRTFFVKERVQRKIPIRVIHRDSPTARERQRLGPSELREVRIIPNTYPYHGIIYIWKNKIAMFSFQNNYVAIVTESRELADMQRALFNNLWELLK